jgi:hypothetical protein
MKITLSTSGIIKFLSIVALILIFIHINILVIYFLVGDPEKFDFVRMFDLDMERNIPTLFSSAILLISALLFYLLSKVPNEQEKGNRLFWLGLSIVFTFLAFDESAKIHENLGDFTENFVDATGYLFYPWVISYSIFVLILGLFYIRFFWRMESKVFWSFMISAAIFLSGAIGFELLGANESSIHGTDTILYSIYYTIEETLEMFGVIYLIKILLNLLEGSSLEVQS